MIKINASKKIAPAITALVGVFRSSLIALAWIMFAVSGYFLSYQIFFTETPLEQLASEISGDVSRKDFRYYQVVYFRGYELQQGQSLKLDVGTPWIARIGKPSVEFFVEIEKPKDGSDTNDSGRIRISGLNAEPFVHQLQPQTQQRFIVPWTNKLGERNPNIEIEYLADDHSSANQTAPPIVLATNVVGFSVWPYIFLFAVAAIALLMFAPAADQRGLFWNWERNRWRLVLVGIAVLMYLLHSGGFTSNVMFDGHRKIGAACKNIGTLLQTGNWKPTFYRDTGIAGIPLLTYLIEGNVHRIAKPFCHIYPTTGYLFYGVWLAGVLFIVNTLRGLWSARLAMVFAAVTAFYFPFLVDLFKPDADAYLIVLFAFVFGLVIRLLYDFGSFTANVTFILLLTFLMGFTKVTPIFLTLLLPITLLMKDWSAGHRRALVRCAVSFFALFIAFQAGKLSSNQFQHPVRHVGIEGEPFQRHVLWHVIWAAYGLYDADSAHDFVKHGGKRNKRVAERTNLPNSGLLRHSEAATQQVYKPDVLKALAERPGFFLSTAMHRFHKHGLRFFRYNRLGGKREAIFSGGQKGKAKQISGKRRSGVTPAVELIRYGEAWKIAPLIFIGKLTQADMTRLADTLLLAVALIGMFGFKSVPLRFFLVMLAVAQMAFSFAFHDVDRYFMFCSWSLLLGLSLFICNFVGAVNRRKI